MGYDSLDREDYVGESGQINRKHLARDMVFSKGFLTEMKSGHMLHYEDGAWRDSGREVAEHWVEMVLGSKASEYHVRETIGHIKRSTYIDRSSYFDMPPRYLPVENGVLDIVEGALVEDHRPETHDPMGRVKTKTVLPVKWREGDVDAEPFLNFLDEVTGNERDKRLLLEFIGHCLYRDWIDHKCLMLLGDGANGKSVYLQTAINFLGEENVTSIALQDIDRDEYAVAELDGKLANICSDISRSALYNTGKFKSLTGEDLVRAQRKYENPFQFRNTAKMAYAANTLPKSEDTTDAFFRRWMVVEFPYTFKGQDADPHLADKLSKPEVQRGILVEAVKAFQDLHRREEFSMGGTTESIKARWEFEADTTSAFVKEKLGQSTSGFETRNDIYSEYEKYCEERGVPSESRQSLYGTIRREMNVVQDSRSGSRERGWRGLELVDEGGVEETQEQPAELVVRGQEKDLSSFDGTESSGGAEYVEVHVLDDLPAIMGVDGEEYSLQGGESVELPKPNAEALIDRGAAERVD